MPPPSLPDMQGIALHPATRIPPARRGHLPPFIHHTARMQARLRMRRLQDSPAL